MSLLRSFTAAVVVIVGIDAPARDASSPVEPPRGWLGAGLVLRDAPGGNRILHVERIVPGGPADRAGIRPLSVVDKIDGVRIAFRTEKDFFDYSRRLVPGQKVRLHVLSGTSRRTVVVTVAPFPAEFHDAWRKQYQIAAARAAKAIRRQDR